jgi:SAM-dependent methyltransferase
MACLDEVGSLAPGPAGGVQGLAGGQAIDDRAHHRFFHLDERIAGGVVARRPRLVSGEGIELGDVVAERQGGLVEAGNQGADLFHPGPDEVHVPAERLRVMARPSRPRRSSRRRMCLGMRRILAQLVPEDHPALGRYSPPTPDRAGDTATMDPLDDPAYYGDLWAETYDAETGLTDPAPAAELLAELAGGGPALELGIGTGRVALPLAAAGVKVTGVDASEAMVARLRAKPGGEAIPVRLGDMATMDLGGPYRLVFVVANTFFCLLSQERQVDCFRNVAAALEPGGRFVIQSFVPDVARFRDGNQTTRVISAEPESLRLNVSTHDPVLQQVHTQVVLLRQGQLSFLPVTVRYAWPAELDLMAALAGLRLESRWAGWRREAFSAGSTSHVSVYVRSGASSE